MDYIFLKDISFYYGTTKIIDSINLSLPKSGIFSILGPSGCGKSTLLRLISFLETPTHGKIYINGKNITSHFSGLRYSFQDFDAFPWKTVKDNLLLSGAITNSNSVESFELNYLLKIIGLKRHENKYPAELSGGMRKRLALGRCIASKPNFVLLDEPFSSLDIDARYEMYDLLQTLFLEWNGLILIVTHDINEAVFLSKKIFISGPLPFHIKKEIEIPFDYPRTNEIQNRNIFINLINEVNKSLRS